MLCSTEKINSLSLDVYYKINLIVPKQPKAKKYIYKFSGSHHLLKGLKISFREDNREAADIYAQKEAFLFGEDTKAVFLKEI